MNNFKKIGMTALAASLVSTSVFAGEVTVAGGASINWENYSGIAKSSTKSFSMGNQLTFSGSGELDNGMTVGISFVLDQGDDTAIGSGPFDSHSVSVSSDALGTLVFHGEGGDSAQNAVGDTAAGNIWDNFDTRVTGAATLSESQAGNNIMHYTLPSLVDDLTVAVSYTPAGANDESSSAFGLTYAGVEGLSVSYGQGSADGDAVGSGGTAANSDTTSLKASYAIGSFTLAYSDHDHDSNTDTSDQTASSWKVSYTVSDAVSVTYGTESLDSAATADTSDAEYTKITASHTSGGMTVSANYQEATEMSYTTATDEDEEYYGLSLSFAF
ncbi:porin [Candidatus Pelagibacter sp.]|nr:porin [Candidatus Pelagibacter sp.]MDC1483502.1 porin [Pelagibacteraceae bacterium]